MHKIQCAWILGQIGGWYHPKLVVGMIIFSALNKLKIKKIYLNCNLFCDDMVSMKSLLFLIFFLQTFIRTWKTAQFSLTLTFDVITLCIILFLRCHKSFIQVMMQYTSNYHLMTMLIECVLWCTRIPLKVHYLFFDLFFLFAERIMIHEIYVSAYLYCWYILICLVSP